MLYVSATYIVWNKIDLTNSFGDQKLGGRCNTAQHIIHIKQSALQLY